MGRLTRRENGKLLYRISPSSAWRVVDKCIVGYEAIKKLAHYEDMEEQGRLIEQKHGHWIYKHDEGGNTGNAQYECSECSAGDLHAKSQEVAYCWKCGAKMDEVEG